MAYLWVIFVILASLGQVVRNAMQRGLTASLALLRARSNPIRGPQRAHDRASIAGPSSR